MIAQELMIGDWVCHQDYQSIPLKVDSISYKLGLKHSLLWNDESRKYERIDRHAETDYDEMNAIPLTPEILEKNGFESYSHESNLFWGIKIAEGYLVLTYMDYYWEFTIDTTIYIRIKIQYVHKLQHALRLCGIDKEIIL